eukprot:COSAG06_NODE_1689_length_8706_cov_7.834669_3_plen_37_part_00
MLGGGKRQDLYDARLLLFFSQNRSKVGLNSLKMGLF